MTKTRIKALSVFLVVAMLLLTVFVVHTVFVQHAFAEEAVDSGEQGGDNDFVETLPEDKEEGNGGLLAGLLDNLITVIIVGVLFVTVILPGIILGIIVSARRERNK